MNKHRARSVLSTLIAASAFVFAAAPSSAQVVKTNFGPGDSYSGAGYGVFSGQSLAQGFVYGGPAGAFLAQIRMAMSHNSGGYTIGLRHGASVGTAATLESWSVSSFAGGILTLSSTLNPTFVSGDTYWITAMSATGSGRWLSNDRGVAGSYYALPGNNTNWTSCPSCASGAYDVTVNATTTPEPASLVLLASGMIGLGIPMIRRRLKA